MVPDIRDDGRAVAIGNRVAGPTLIRAVELSGKRVLLRKVQGIAVVSSANPNFRNNDLGLASCRGTGLDPSLDCKIRREAQTAAIRHDHRVKTPVETGLCGTMCGPQWHISEACAPTFDV